MIDRIQESKYIIENKIEKSIDYMKTYRRFSEDGECRTLHSGINFLIQAVRINLKNILELSNRLNEANKQIEKLNKELIILKQSNQNLEEKNNEIF